MLTTIKGWIVDWFTEKDESACPVRLAGIFMVLVMGVKFILLKAPGADYFQSAGIGAAAVMAAMVVKSHLEDR